MDLYIFGNVCICYPHNFKHLVLGTSKIVKVFLIVNEIEEGVVVLNLFIEPVKILV